MPSFDLAMGSFQAELVRRRVRLMESHSRRSAKLIAKLVAVRYGRDMRDAVILSSLAKQYGVVKELIPLTVAHAIELLNS